MTPGRSCRLPYRLAGWAVATRISAAWQRRFVEQWPPQSEAHLSYYRRIVGGPNSGIEQALCGRAAAA